MQYNKDFIPQKPFDEFKWQWACFTCTESLNDPVILLGVLSKMSKLEGKVKYSSKEFSDELRILENDIEDVVTVNLSGRGGERNIIRNSGQYWKNVGLIDDNSRGNIKLTEFGRKIANHEISQSEFAVVTIKNMVLPNIHVYKSEIVEQWRLHNIFFHPLQLILQILSELGERDATFSYITAEELFHIVIPLSGVKADIQDYANFIQWYREGEISIDHWPDVCPEANDKRMAREFLLFLKNYGYLIEEISSAGRYKKKYYLNRSLIDEVEEIIELPSESLFLTIDEIRQNDIVTSVDRKRVSSMRLSRPNQRKFRKNILEAYQGRCIFTNVTMPEVLEAAHIRPVEYNGNDSTGNGICMREDIHTLFDTGHLRIDLDGKVELSQSAMNNYGDIIPKQIVLPQFVNKEYLLWRWNYYNGI